MLTVDTTLLCEEPSPCSPDEPTTPSGTRSRLTAMELSRKDPKRYPYFSWSVNNHRRAASIAMDLPADLVSHKQCSGYEWDTDQCDVRFCAHFAPHHEYLGQAVDWEMEFTDRSVMYVPINLHKLLKRPHSCITIQSMEHVKRIRTEEKKWDPNQLEPGERDLPDDLWRMVIGMVQEIDVYGSENLEYHVQRFKSQDFVQHKERLDISVPPYRMNGEYWKWNHINLRTMSETRPLKVVVNMFLKIVNNMHDYAMFLD